MKNKTSILLMLVMFLIAFSSLEAMAKPQFTAMFVFGDSLIDPGNNIYFIDTVSKAKYLPYGIDYPVGPTGRFCNGKIFTDFLGEVLEIPLTPSYAETVVLHASVSWGVNYASAGSGILDNTGMFYVFIESLNKSRFLTHCLAVRMIHAECDNIYGQGRVMSRRKQIDNFKHTLKQLGNQMQEEDLSNYLAKALVVDEFGFNDYAEYYLFPFSFSKGHNPQEFADFLISQYTERILEQHRLGLRKFLLVEIPPLGCLPVARTLKPHSPGKCVAEGNDLVRIFNSGLKALVRRLNSVYPGSVFVLAGAYQLFYELHDNAESYGFKVKDSSCCKTVLNVPLTVACAEFSVPCSNRDEFLFWDSAHPTEAVNGILVRETYGNESYTFPMSIQKMAKM